jgi:hypothetical protein
MSSVLEVLGIFDYFNGLLSNLTPYFVSVVCSCIILLGL